MNTRDIVVIGTSAGGLSALIEMVGSLPPDLDASIFIVQHLMPTSPSVLPQILNHHSPLLSSHAEDGEVFQKNRIYIAPPDHHMILEKDRMLVKKGPKENRFRPSIDALFRSAAYEYGPRVTGIVLSGLLDDGTSGLWSIKRFGGTAIIQHPDEAEFSSMPSSVLEYVEVDHIVAMKELGPLLHWLTKEKAINKNTVTQEEANRTRIETEIALQKSALNLGIMNLGNLSPLTCPECNGTLVEIKEGPIIRYRCHTGHGFSLDSLLTDISESIEANIWQTIKGLEEAILLLEQMGHQLNKQGKKTEAEAFFRKSRQTHQRSEWLRTFFLQKEANMREGN